MGERPAYADLYFGLSDSRNEYTSQRDEFVRSFVDLKNVSSAITSGKKLLVLGPKGTGKSAVAWYLAATDVTENRLSLTRDASALPLAEIPRLQTGQAEGPERTVVAWKFILLCNYLELLLSDMGCSLNRDPEVIRVTNLLRDFGFMGDASGRALLKASTATVKIPIPKIGEIYRRESRPDLNIFNLNPYLEKWAASATSSNRHVLILDGLDSIFLNDRKYNESVASLVQAAYSLNQQLSAGGAGGSIVLLLRNDVFTRIALSVPDSQKMRDDFGVELDWRILSGEAGRNAPLMQLANAKAARALDVASVDVLSYFPKEVQMGRRGAAPRWMPTLRYLLNLTRHTPRDLLRLFEEIRAVEESGVFDSREGPLSREVIREGVLQYSGKYFVNAIRNEFAGFDGGAESAAAALSALQHLNSRHFTRQEFAAALNEVGVPDGVTVNRLLTLLFYAGAIGNYVARRDHETYMQFYHRRDDAEVYLGGGNSSSTRPSDTRGRSRTAQDREGAYCPTETRPFYSTTVAQASGPSVVSSMWCRSSRQSFSGSGTSPCGQLNGFPYSPSLSCMQNGDRRGSRRAVHRSYPPRVMRRGHPVCGRLGTGEA